MRGPTSSDADDLSVLTFDHLWTSPGGRRIRRKPVLPSSTTLEENSNFRVSWEQLESQADGCCGLVLPLDPPSGSVPNKGRKPASSPKRTDTQTANGSILTCFALTKGSDLVTRKEKPLRRDFRLAVGPQRVKSSAPDVNPYFKQPGELD